MASKENVLGNDLIRPSKSLYNLLLTTCGGKTCHARQHAFVTGTPATCYARRWAIVTER